MENIKKTFGTNLFIVRKSKGLTGDDLANKLNVSKGCISQWETGKRQPTPDLLMKLCEILGVTAADLYTPMLHDISKEHLPLHKSNVPEQFTPIKKKQIPVVGAIACGEPIFADESIEFYADVASDLRADFALWAKGD